MVTQDNRCVCPDFANVKQVRFDFSVSRELSLDSLSFVFVQLDNRQHLINCHNDIFI